MKKIIKKFISFETRKFDLEFLSKEKLEIFMPQNVYEEYRATYKNLPVQEKGLFNECLAHLLLNRMFSDYRPTENCYEAYDAKTLDGVMIDFKFTERHAYYLDEMKYVEARYLSLIHQRPFHFILITPYNWNDEACSITLKIHHILTLVGYKDSEKVLGTYKRIVVRKESAESYA